MTQATLDEIMSEAREAFVELEREIYAAQFQNGDGLPGLAERLEKIARRQARIVELVRVMKAIKGGG